MGKVSATCLKYAGRCLMAGAMYRYVDPDSERKVNVSSSEATAMHEGTYFESVLFDSEPSKPDPGYIVWSTSQNSSRRQRMAEIARLARMCQDDFDMANSRKQVELSADILGVTIRGILDYSGLFDGVDDAVVDTKLTGDIEREWNPEYFLENSGKMMQVPLYCVLKAYLSWTDEQRMVFDQCVADKTLSIGVPDQLKDLTFPVGYYYVVESKDTSESEISQPIVRRIKVTTSMSDAIQMIQRIVLIDSVLTVYENAYDRWRVTKEFEEDLAEPTQSKCMGNYMTAHKSRCPFFMNCPWGRSLLHNTITIQTSDLL